MELIVVNVFSEQGLQGGNQLGVVLDAASLTTSEMETITRQLNYSESTFITKTSETDASFRIFVPEGEIPYAGHPIIGTCYVLEYLNRQTRNFRDTLNIHLIGGDVQTYFDKDLDITYLEQLPVLSYGDFENKDDLMKCLGLDDNQLLSQTFPIISPSSLKFIFIAVQSLQDVDTLNPDFSQLKSLEETEDYGIYVFSKGGRENGDFYARMFAPSIGINEDPATGAAQSAFVHALQQLDLLIDQPEIIVEQGYRMKRPSVIYNQIRRDDDGNLKIRTGGKCHLALKGEIYLK